MSGCGDGLYSSVTTWRLTKAVSVEQYRTDSVTASLALILGKLPTRRVNYC
jgi:hypothetical protein